MHATALLDPPLHAPLGQRLLAACWALLEIEALADPAPVSLRALLPTRPWVTEAAPYKHDVTTETLRLLSGAKRGPSGIFRP